MKKVGVAQWNFMPENYERGTLEHNRNGDHYKTLSMQKKNDLMLLMCIGRQCLEKTRLKLSVKKRQEGKMKINEFLNF